MILDLEKNKLNIFVAYLNENRGIGKDNNLPWGRLLTADLKYINCLTARNDVAVIMGRKTFESIGRPLAKRINIVLTRKEKIDGCFVFNSLDEAIKYCKANNLFIVIFGGENVYIEALKYEFKLFCTIVYMNNSNADAFFPICDVNLKNVSLEVDKLLGEKNVKKTWNICNDKFIENSIEFSFNIGYSKN
ncbi:hypothetical protein GVAV_000171 [Gurleya vavrai]